MREAARAKLIKAQNCNSENGLVPSGWAQLSKPEIAIEESALTIDISGCRISVNAKTDPELLAKKCLYERDMVQWKKSSTISSIVLSDPITGNVCSHVIPVE